MERLIEILNKQEKDAFLTIKKLESQLPKGWKRVLEPDTELENEILLQKGKLLAINQTRESLTSISL